MNRPSRPIRPVLLAVLATLVAGSAWAQPQAPPQDPRAVGPYRGLFGGNALDPNSRDQLDFTLSLFGGYDDNVTANDGGSGGFGGDPRAQASSSYGGASAALRYARNIFERVSFQAGANASSSYYADLDSLIATSYGANAALNWRINNRTGFNLAQTFSFSPFFAYAFFPVPGIVEGVDSYEVGYDARVLRQDNVAYATTMSFSRNLTKRSTFSVSGNWQRTDFTGESAVRYRDHQYYGAGAQWTYRLTEHASARLGYGYYTGDYGSAGERRLETHNIDVGIDYNRSLSFSRRTRLAFGTGTVAYASQRPGTDVTSEEFQFTVIGDARLSHEIGRSWVASAGYNRGVRLMQGFTEPFITDAATFTLGGFLGPRSRLSLVGGVNWGNYGTTAETQRSTRVAYVTPSFQFALLRSLALQASYFYYHYRFDEGGAPLPLGFLPEYSRQGFRVGLSLWVPLLVAGTR